MNVIGRMAISMGSVIIILGKTFLLFKMSIANSLVIPSHLLTIESTLAGLSPE